MLPSENTPQISEDILRFILGSVNEWLRFAEAKNAGLFSANLALTFGTITIAFGDTVTSQLVQTSLLICAVILGISAIICLISFIPQLSRMKIKLVSNPMETDNLLFFGDIAKYDAKAYIIKLSGLYLNSNTDNTKQLLLEKYADQIIINSRIAKTKYYIFGVAVVLTAIALTLLLMIFVLWGMNGLFHTNLFS